MILKIGLLEAVAIIAALLALYWLRPETGGGQALLAIIVFALVNGLAAAAAGIGRLIWRAKA